MLFYLVLALLAGLSPEAPEKAVPGLASKVFDSKSPKYGFDLRPGLVVEPVDLSIDRYFSRPSYIR